MPPSADPKYPDDRKRPLTPEGIKRFKDAVRGLVALDLELDVILTSPLTRAEETATLLATGFKKRVPMETLEALAPGGKPAAIVEAIKSHAKRHRRIALVGHEPDLGELAAKLLGCARARGVPQGRGVRHRRRWRHARRAGHPALSAAAPHAAPSEALTP